MFYTIAVQVVETCLNFKFYSENEAHFDTKVYMYPSMFRIIYIYKKWSGSKYVVQLVMIKIALDLGSYSFLAGYGFFMN